MSWVSNTHRQAHSRLPEAKLRLVGIINKNKEEYRRDAGIHAPLRPVS